MAEESTIKGGLVTNYGKVPIDRPNTVHLFDKVDRDVSCCKFYKGHLESSPVTHCFNEHPEIVDLGSPMKVDYRRCKAYNLIKNVMGKLK